MFKTYLTVKKCHFGNFSGNNNDMNVKDSEIKDILQTHKKVVVIGMSKDPSKPSQTVPLLLKSKGHDVVGVNPAETEIAGMTVYPNLAAVPVEYRKFVDVFRKPEAIPAIVDEILRLGGTEVLWLQLGITHPEAEKKAEAAGIRVISDRCPAIEYRKF